MKRRLVVATVKKCSKSNQTKKLKGEKRKNYE
ncbi:MAG: hypothetical protein IJX03_05235 [Clostridia bacterium]|nr:hypothetical protein [Clostridia bacterium]